MSRYGAAGGRSVTLALIAANVLVAAYAFLLEPNMAVKFGLIPGLVSRGQWWRLLTSMFVHADLIHLASNMMALLYSGSLLEGACGRFKMLAVYVLSGLAGGGLVMLLESAGSVTVGASGAIFGVMAASFVVARKRFGRGAGAALGQNLLVNVIYTFTVPGISVGGHVGGLVAGFALALILCR